MTHDEEMAAHARRVCPWCGRANENSPADHYHQSACQADALLKQIDEAKARGASAAELRRLNHRLEMARYVGD